MRSFKNEILATLPESTLMCSEANQGEETEEDISKQGKRLAVEINKFLEELELKYGYSVGRISFIGFSLGGLTVRAALPYLKKFKEKMHGFLTLGTPHLGFKYTPSKLFNAGMWVLKKWKSTSQCLKQLNLSDEPVFENTYLYTLSRMEGLNWFKHILLCSSMQDTYVNFDTARIQITGEPANDPKDGNAYIQMARNLLSEVPASVLYRVDVNFDITEKNFDTFTGRKAHIQFIENKDYMQMLIQRFKEFFS